MSSLAGKQGPRYRHMADDGAPYETIAVEKLTPIIGAEISGVDLGKLSDAEFAVIHDALVRHEVIVFRDQDITIEAQMDFGRRFGELSIHPFSPNPDDKREVIVLDNHKDNPPHLTDQWHADETFRTAPPLGTILRAKVSPEIGCTKAVT